MIVVMSKKRKECNVYLNNEHPSIKFRKCSIIVKGLKKIKEHLNIKRKKKIGFLKEKKRKYVERENIRKEMKD